MPRSPVRQAQDRIDRLVRRLEAARRALRNAKANAGIDVHRHSPAAVAASRHSGLARREGHSAVYRPRFVEIAELPPGTPLPQELVQALTGAARD